MTDVTSLTRNFLMFVIIPPWVVVGILDWWCHRRSDIEHTSGVKESASHFLEIGEAAIPVVFGLLFEPDALVLSVMIFAFVLHTITAIWDVAYADARRKITPTEQHCHGVMEVLPFTVVAFIGCLHWRQLASIVGVGDAPDFGLRLVRDLFPLSTKLLVLGGVGAVLAPPYLEELWRCIRVARSAPPAGDR